MFMRERKNVQVHCEFQYALNIEVSSAGVLFPPKQECGFHIIQVYHLLVESNMILLMLTCLLSVLCGNFEKVRLIKKTTLGIKMRKNSVLRNFRRNFQGNSLHSFGYELSEVQFIRLRCSNSIECGTLFLHFSQILSYSSFGAIPPTFFKLFMNFTRVRGKMIFAQVCLSFGHRLVNTKQSSRHHESHGSLATCQKIACPFEMKTNVQHLFSGSYLPFAVFEPIKYGIISKYLQVLRNHLMSNANICSS